MILPHETAAERQRLRTLQVANFTLNTETHEVRVPKRFHLSDVFIFPMRSKIEAGRAGRRLQNDARIRLVPNSSPKTTQNGPFRGNSRGCASLLRASAAGESVS